MSYSFFAYLSYKYLCISILDIDLYNKKFNTLAFGIAYNDFIYKSKIIYPSSLTVTLENHLLNRLLQIIWNNLLCTRNYSEANLNA